MSSEWFLAHWPVGADRWSVEFYCDTEDQLTARLGAWLEARPQGAKGSYIWGDFDVCRAKHSKELRRVVHNRHPDFARTLDTFGRRTMIFSGSYVSGVGRPAYWGFDS